MTSCDLFADRVDVIASGNEPTSAGDRDHLASCAACRAMLARAHAIDATCRARPTPQPPPGFTAQVMTAVRGERWRAERSFDFGFNLAVVGGVLLVAAGLIGLAWSSGLIVIGGDLAALISAAVAIVVERAAVQAPNVGLATLLLSMALAIWWWAEGIEA